MNSPEPLIHPLAPAHLPSFISGPDGVDVMLFNIVLLLLALILLGVVMYLRIHSIPERMAAEKNHSQLALIALLGLLGLLMHNTTLWVFAIVLAVIQFPDFLGPLSSIADSLRKIAQGSRQHDVEVPIDSAAEPPEPSSVVEQPARD